MAGKKARRSAHAPMVLRLNHRCGAVHENDPNGKSLAIVSTQHKLYPLACAKQPYLELNGLLVYTNFAC